MLALLVESALRSLALGLAVGLGLRLFRMRNPQLEMTAWKVVLIASLSMPLLMQGLTVTIATDVPPQLVSPSRITDALTSPYLQPEVPMFPPPMSEPNEAQPHRAAMFAGLDWRSLAAGLYLLVGGVMLVRLLTGIVLTWLLR